VRALRRDLAELAVDAERALPEGQAWNLDIVTEQLVMFEAEFEAVIRAQAGK